MALLTAILHWARGWHDLPLDVLLFLLLTVVSALAGGIGPALAAAVLGAWPSTGSSRRRSTRFTISDPQNLVVLLVYIVVALAVSSAVHLSDRAAAAQAAQREAAALAQSAETLLAERDQLPALLRQVVEFFSMEGAAVARRASVRDPWVVVAATTASLSSPSRARRCGRPSTTSTPWCSSAASSAARTAVWCPRSRRGRR